MHVNYCFFLKSTLGVCILVGNFASRWDDGMRFRVLLSDSVLAFLVVAGICGFCYVMIGNLHSREHIQRSTGFAFIAKESCFGHK